MLQYAKIFASHPESNSVDVETHNGRKFFGVRVLSAAANTVDLPDATKENPVDALLSFYDSSVPVIVGFLPPQITNSNFKENRAINRHHSGTYSSINENGDYEVFHPSGAYIRFSESIEHEDLTAKDVDKKWKNDKNTDQNVNICVGFAGSKAYIILSKEGKLTFRGESEFLNSATFKDNVTMDKNLDVTEKITSQEDVLAVTVSLKNHLHGNGNNGANTTAPVAS